MHTKLAIPKPHTRSRNISDSGQTTAKDILLTTVQKDGRDLKTIYRLQTNHVAGFSHVTDYIIITI